MPPRVHSLFALAVLATVLAPGRSAWGAAETFQGSRRLYPEKVWSLDDIPVPHVEVVADPNLPDGVGSGPRFEIRSYEIVGATLIPPSELIEVVAPYLGADRGFDDIKQAREAVQRAYDERGFQTAIVSLPKQTLRDGRIRIEVTEARVGLVTVDNPGVDWFSDAQIRRLTPHITPGAILRSEDIGEDLARARRNPDRNVTPVLKPGSEEGTVDVDLKVEDSIPLHASVEWNNDYTFGSPENRMSVSLAYTNLWGRDHEASLFYQFVPWPSQDFSDVQIYSLSYRAPMPWSDGQSLLAYAAYSDTTTLIESGGSLNSLGKGLTAGLRYDVDLPGFEAAPWYEHRFVVGADYKDIETRLLAGLDEISTPIQYLPWTVEYNALVRTEQAITSFRVGTRFHFAGIVSGSDDEDFQRNRGGIRDDNTANGTWAYLILGINTSIRLPGLLTTLGQGHFVDLPAPTRNFRDDWVLALNMNGQYSDTPLIGVEQFPIGGRLSVRGYLLGEVFGDSGWNMQLELRSATLRQFVNGWLGERLQAVAFYDVGEAYLLNERDEGKVQFRERLQGFGVGLRTSFYDYMFGELFFAVPTTDTGITTAWDPRLQFMLRAQY